MTTHRSLRALVALCASLVSSFAATQAAHAQEPQRSSDVATGATIHPEVAASVLSLSPLTLAHGAPNNVADASGGAAVVALAPLEHAWRGITVTTTAGAMRDAFGAGAVWTRATAMRDVGALRLAATIHAAHSLAAGRDPLDLTVIASATVRVAGPLRAGMEYVAQDAEAGFEDDGDGGMHASIGPVMVVDLPRRLFVQAGPAMLLWSTPGSSPIATRVGIGYAF